MLLPSSLISKCERSVPYFSGYTEIRLRAGVVIALSRIEQICLENGRVLPKEARSEIEYLLLVWHAAWSRLSEDALSRNVCRWAHRPKHHYTDHAFLDSNLNPRYGSNYQSEDMVKKVKHVAAGSHAAYLSQHVTLKYALQVGLRWR